MDGSQAPAWDPGRKTLLFGPILQFLEQDGYERGEVLDDAVMSHLKDGGMGIGVDSYDGLRPPDAGNMLKGP